MLTNSEEGTLQGIENLFQSIQSAMLFWNK